MNTTDHFRVTASLIAIDGSGKLLLIKETKSSGRTGYNFPGGHIDPEETLAEAAERELLEEAGMKLKPTRLLGIYKQGLSVNFVYIGYTQTTHTIPGEGIESCKWMSMEEIGHLGDEAILRPKKLRAIMKDLEQGGSLPRDIVREIVREE